ncbi:hypothetical protein ACVWYH_005650 [Bradyrhizobium sp. GM24.11]
MNSSNLFAGQAPPSDKALRNSLKPSGFSRKAAAPKASALRTNSSGSRSPHDRRMWTASSGSRGSNWATTIALPDVALRIGTMSADLRQSSERQVSRHLGGACFRIAFAKVCALSSTPPSVRYSSSASRYSVVPDATSVPVISSRTVTTGVFSRAASASSTVDFPMPGSPSSTTNGWSRRSLTRAIPRFSRSCPSRIRIRRSISTPSYSHASSGRDACLSRSRITYFEGSPLRRRR